MAKIYKLMEIERVLDAQDWSVDGKWRVIANRYRVAFEGDKKCSRVDCGDSCITLNIGKKH